MMRWWVLTLLLVNATPVVAQSGGADFLTKLDTNGNGILEPSEVPEAKKGLIERAAKYAGLDPAQPMPLEQLRSGKPAANPPAAQAAPVKAVGPATQGFGAAGAKQSAPGAAAESASPGSVKPATVSGETPAKPAGEDARERVRNLADGMLKQYDLNKNGVLEKDEWSKMRGDHQAADANKDGTITLDELASHLTTVAGAPSGEVKPAVKKARRFLTAVERLPAGLPSWFNAADKDRDGQVMMHEFSATWSDAKAAEFSKYDLNGDGVLTPRELLKPAKSEAKR